ncbi:MAG: TrkH family potassium uptake protein [Actinomycetia bacterium]|nr:TrkH family potassium uptake protein [Actinomycetes bacterium]
MWPRFGRDDLANICRYLGILVQLLAVLMLAPLIVSLLFGEFAVSAHYLVGIGCALAVGSLLRLARVAPSELKRKQAIVVTGLIWIVAALVAAVPLWLSGHFLSYFDAFFECVSGFTATGLSLARNIDHASMADNMWRFMMQFLGGQGVIVIALSIGLFSKTGSSFYNAEGREEFVMPYIKRTAQFIWRFSAVVTLIGTSVLCCITMILGMEPPRALFHSLWLTIGSYDTGGFAPQGLSMIYYHSWPLEFITMVLMCMGAVNFAVYARLWHGNWKEAVRDFFRDIELRTLAAWIALILVLFTAALVAGGYLDEMGTLLRRGFFTIVSAATNTGYQLFATHQTTSLLSSGAFMILIISMALGGSVGSTAGGIKALRVGIVFKLVVARTKALLSPGSARDTTSYYHNGRHLISTEAANTAMVVTLLYIVSYLLGTLAGIVAGYDALPSALESVSAASNAGLSAGIVTPDAPLALKVVYVLQMWMGRLEFFTLLALFAGLLASLKPRKRRG